MMYQAGTLTSDTTYNVTLSNANGSTTEEVTVTVNPLALPTVTITTDVTAINIGDDPGAAIEVTISGADSVNYTSSPANTFWDNLSSTTYTSLSVSPSCNYNIYCCCYKCCRNYNRGCYD